jgi:hypothetical protein
MSQPGNNSDHSAVEKSLLVSNPAPVTTADGALSSASPSSEGDSDRRSWPRRKRAIQVILQDAGGEGDPFPAWIMDRSIGGLGLSVDQPLEPGTILRVRRATAATDVPWAEIQVKSVRIKENTWEVGCQFTRSHSVDVLMQFG